LSGQRAAFPERTSAFALARYGETRESRARFWRELKGKMVWGVPKRALRGVFSSRRTSEAFREIPDYQSFSDR